MTITLKGHLSLKDFDSVSLADILRTKFVDTYPLSHSTRLNNAIKVASYLHRSDVRRGARGKTLKPPYIEHPLRVAVRLFRYFGVTNPDILIAAILHDTVEDHPFEFADFEGVREEDDEEQARAAALEFISLHFGFAVAHLVNAMSNPLLPPDIPKAEKILSYQEHVTRAVQGSNSVLILKFADFVDNAGSLHHHYEPGDSSVTYFLDRYEPLIDLYRTEFSTAFTAVFNVKAARDRLDAVEEQFKKLRAGVLTPAESVS